jgi:hypothetical protein
VIIDFINRYKRKYGVEPMCMSTIPEHWTISGPAILTHLRQRWESDFIGGLGGDPPVASQ